MTTDIYSHSLEQLRLSGNLRSTSATPAPAETVDMSSNDYLSLATRSSLQQKFLELRADNLPAMTTSAARLLAADQSEHALLEQRLSELYGGKHALLFNSGYHANTGLISALASVPRTIILADRLVHASIIDGIVLSRAPFKRFAHNDFNHLERLIKATLTDYDRLLVVVESVYSMDGDAADIRTLIELKRRYPQVLLYVDEAHAVGVNGPQGLGLCMASGAFEEIDVVVGTFGKALASMGAFCIASPTLREFAVNRSRSFIFSTALPPINCAWTRFMLEESLGMDAEREHLQQIARQLQEGVSTVIGNSTGSPSHILPIIIGDANRTVQLSNRLLEAGFKVLPIRTPTVPPGTERLRVSLSAALSAADIDRFLTSLVSLGL